MVYVSSIVVLEKLHKEHVRCAPKAAPWRKTTKRRMLAHNIILNNYAVWNVDVYYTETL